MPTLWGYGLLVYSKGDHIEKSMASATGREILAELLHHLGVLDIRHEVSATTCVIPVMMPYITSEFERREVSGPPAIADPEVAFNSLTTLMG